MKKYIIFDLDGTLIKSTESIVEIVVDFISKNFGLDFDQKIRYILSTTKGTALRKQLHMILGDIDNIDEVNNTLYKEIMDSQKTDFLPGTKQKLHDLSKNYTLFLSTANSTESAKKILKEGGVDELFALIIGSEKIIKGPDHIELFRKHSNDEDFFDDTLYVGDGEKDREIAMKFHIDFIHIGSDNIDTYEIPSIRYIGSLLDEINNKHQWKS